MLAVITKEKLFIQTSKALGLNGYKLDSLGEKKPKQSCLFFFSNQRVCQSLFDHITLICHSCGWLLVKCFWLPIVSFLDQLSGCRKSGTHSEYAPNWPLEFNCILEELPVGISCSFLNQLKGPHDAGHGIWWSLPPPPHHQGNGHLWDICHQSSTIPSHDNRTQFCFRGNDSFPTFNLIQFNSMWFIWWILSFSIAHGSRLEHSRTFHAPSHGDWFCGECTIQQEQSGLTKLLNRTYPVTIWGRSLTFRSPRSWGSVSWRTHTGYCKGAPLGEEFDGLLFEPQIKSPIKLFSFVRQ